MLELFSDSAEQAVIGALLTQPDAMDNIHWLQPQAFHFANNRAIYRAIASMISLGKAVDIVTVAEVLENEGVLEMAGGIAYIGSLAQLTSTANLKRYAEIVQERATLRSLLAAVNQIQDDIQSPGDIKAKLERAQSAVMAITETSQTSEPVFVGDLVPSRMERFDQLMQGEIKNAGTGFTDLDEILGGGLEVGTLNIVAARPSMGKTALAVQLAEHIQKPDAAALVFTCEMANGQIVDRLISGLSRVSSDKLRTGHMQDEDWTRLTAVIPKVQKLNMLVDDKTFNINGLRAKARTIKRKYGLSVIVVDYIQLLNGDGDNREQQVSSISRGLKAVAKELEVPVIALSQLSREVEKRANKQPVMSDLRESGAIEQDADTIMFIYRDEYYNTDSIYKGIAEIIIGKNRNGATGKVNLYFDKEHTRFGNFVGSMPEPRQQSRSRGFD